ncbi:hypothetical protein V8E54_002122 [Elaphomyces granulatus]
MRSTLKLHTLRAELELEHYGRQHLYSNCVLMAERLTIFRNNYRSLKDFYLTPANLPSSERRKEDNNFTLTLGPHGATMTDITKSLKLGLQVFEKGVKILVNGIPTTVCAFTMAFTGDMPQQAANSGTLSHNAKIGCRTCYCPRNKKWNLLYGLISHGRYHHDTLLKRQKGNTIRQKSEREKFWKANGLLPDPSPLEDLCPALDLILS